MPRGNRSVLNWLLSGVSVSSTYTALTLGTVAIGILSFFALGQVEDGILIFVRQYEEATFDVFVESVAYLKYIIMLSFICISIFIYLFGKGVRHHINNQAYALELQINSFLEGDWDSRRQMRKHDELKSVMLKIHQLADQRKGKKG